MFKKNNSRKTVSFLVSGRGSNFQAVAEKIISGYIPARAGVLISDKADAAALGKAEKMGIKSVFIDPKLYPSKTDYEKEIIRIMDEFQTDYIVAAGFMRILSPYIINAYRNRIVNIHPSLLPAFPGKDAQKQAIEYGVRVTGCTTHFIDEGTDTGPIIMQHAVKIEDRDTASSLSERLIKEEHKILIKSIKLLCEEKIRLAGRIVIIE